MSESRLTNNTDVSAFDSYDYVTILICNLKKKKH